MVPYGFTAELEDGSKIGHGDKAIMVAEDASTREIEQTVLQRLEAYNFVTNVRWWRLSDYRM